MPPNPTMETYGNPHGFVSFCLVSLINSRLTLRKKDEFFSSGKISRTVKKDQVRRKSLFLDLLWEENHDSLT